LIRFENVGMRYDNDDEILSDIDFELEAGSFHFLTGPSGAGKSSLLKLLYLAHKDIAAKWSASIFNWTAILNELAIHFEQRLSL